VRKDQRQRASRKLFKDMKLMHSSLILNPGQLELPQAPLVVRKGEAKLQVKLRYRYIHLALAGFGSWYQYILAEMTTHGILY
jgi:hypothetical protein